MQAVAETITEHYIMEGERRGLAKGERRGLAKGEARGLAKGEARGLAKGEIIGQLKSLKGLYDDGLIDASVYDSRSRVLRKQLEALQ